MVITDRRHEHIKERSRLSKEEWREYTKTVWHIANVKDPGHPSVFPAEIPRRLIKLFSFVGETVLDPFAGVGTTGMAATDLDRRSVCVDQNEHYIQLMYERWGTAAEGAIIANGDSRNLAWLDDASVDLVVTSPPYWDKADYGGRPDVDLGSIGHYTAFLSEMKEVFTECYRVIRPGRKVCIVTANVTQHTNYGLLTFPLAADFSRVLREVGLVQVNELIWSKDATGGRWGSWGNQRPIFGSYPYPPNFHFKNVHEHILIMMKPPVKETRGPKVKRLQDLVTVTGVA